MTRKPNLQLLIGLGMLLSTGLVLEPAAAQSNERQRAPVVRNQGVARFDAAQRQAANRTVFGHTPSWNGSSGYGGYNQNYFYGGGSGYGQYSQSYFYGNSGAANAANASSPDFDRDGTPDASDNDIDGDGVPNSRDRYDYDRSRR